MSSLGGPTLKKKLDSQSKLNTLSNILGINCEVELNKISARQSSEKRKLAGTPRRVKNH